MEYVVLQPLESESIDLNASLIERKYNLTPDEERLILHEAGGPFSGFIVKKSLPLHLQTSIHSKHIKSDASFKLKVFMRNEHNQEVQEEQRTLHFWFSTPSDRERMTCSNSFFHYLFKEGDFPKDYFMFLLKLMKIFRPLKSLKMLRIEIEKLHNTEPQGNPMSVNDPQQYAAIISGKILEFLERAFPNSISVDELARLTDTEARLVYDFLCNLFERGLVNYYDDALNWTRKIINSHDEKTHEVIMLQQQPTVLNNEQPTVAIITVNYYEKLAVDAMMVNKVTFVRHKADGESNVYTIGNIGEHRVVSTKLPLLGRDSRSAKISSGNTTTRLLGIFQKVEHVFLVGCGGGIPHYSDYSRHPRRGDIYVSYPDPSVPTEIDDNQDFVYAHYEIQKTQTKSQIISKSWMPGITDLYKIVNEIRKTYNPTQNKMYPWEKYIEEGINALQSDELDCRRPEEDKLFFNVSEKNVVEVSHPENTNDSFDRRKYGQPILRFGRIAGGENIVRDENIKYMLTEKYGLTCFDCDMDQVMESIEGNRKDSFIVIRSIVDYHDGTTSKEWHPYASICAAAFAKTLISALPLVPPSP